ncbi:hypothetical protein BJX68DRAFT_242993 [Aspergillus pseudodeflectus]|uniref:F-box domain-containing protein n=1 Tax=Aspergillus pseudodeflectus TaxID=176178 RepID=A0ABR4JX67_9EURO
MPPVRRSRRLQSLQSSAKASHQTQTRNQQSTKQTLRGPFDRPGPRIVRQQISKTQTYLNRPSSKVLSDPNHATHLFRIPRELLYTITTHLLPAGLACLTLTCKLAVETLGMDIWAEFRGRARLLHGPEGSLCKLLARDLPGHEYCVRCETAHPPLRPPREHRVNKFTQSCFGSEATIDYWPQKGEAEGYSLVWPHIQRAFEEREPGVVDSGAIELFNGDFTIQAGTVNYTLCSSARWIKRNLILRQEYRLSSTQGNLQAVDVTSLPLRICAHHTTATALPTPPSVRHNAAKPAPNCPLLIHAIATAFPDHLRKKVPGPNLPSFRDPAASDATQMRVGGGDPGFIWRCRSCPTKFRVAYIPENDGELVVHAWYCFGKEIHRAVDYWTWFVRRDLASMGVKKRNSEFYAPSRSVPDFAIE